MNHIDQTNFVATATAHVFHDTGLNKFFFTDETSEANGPYDTLFEAESRMEGYCIAMNAPKGINGAAIRGMLFTGAEGVGNGLDMLSTKGAILTAEQFQHTVDEMMNTIVVSCEAQDVPDGLQLLAATVLSVELSRADSEELLERIQSGLYMTCNSHSEAFEYIQGHFLAKHFIEFKDDTGTMMYASKNPDPVKLSQELSEHFWKDYHHKQAGGEHEGHKDHAVDSLTQELVEQRASVIIAWAFTKILADANGDDAEDKILRVGRQLARAKMQAMQEMPGGGGLSSLLKMIEAGPPSADDVGEVTSLITSMISSDCVVHTHTLEDKCVNSWSRDGEINLKDTIISCIKKANQA